MPVPLEECFKCLSQAMAIGITTGVMIDLLAYGITKTLGLINIKL